MLMGNLRVRRLFLLLLLIFGMLPVMSATAQTCEPSALRVGLSVRVRSGVNLRAAAGLDARVVGGLPVGRTLTLVGGPICASAITWWQVEGATTGWIAEASHGAVYLEPVQTAVGEFLRPLPDFTVQYGPDAVIALPSNQCPPPTGDLSINYTGVSDPQASGGEAAFFVDGGFGTPLPALCIPAARGPEATLLTPQGMTFPAVIEQTDPPSDFVRATLMESALLLPGTWQLAAPDFVLNIRVTGPLAPMMDTRIVDGILHVLFVGFAPSERVALLLADVDEAGAASTPRLMIITTDGQGMGGADLAGVTQPILAAVSESGLVALPSDVQALNFDDAATVNHGYDLLVGAVWGYEVLGLPEPTEIPSAPEPTAEPTVEATPEPTADATEAAVTPAAEPTGIVNLPQPTATPEANACVYVVKRGDTFFRIALAHGLTTAQLRAANPHITNAAIIFSGNELNIPNCQP